MRGTVLAAMASAGLLLAACAPTAPPRGPSAASATVPAPAPEVRDRLEAELRQAGLEIVASTDGSIRAERRSAVPAAWFSCRRILVSDTQSDFNRQDWASPRGARMVVNVGLSPLGGQTSTTVVAEVLGLYRDRYRNLPFERPCASTGALEQQLLAAARG